MRLRANANQNSFTLQVNLVASSRKTGSRFLAACSLVRQPSLRKDEAASGISYVGTWVADAVDVAVVDWLETKIFIAALVRSLGRACSDATGA